MNLLKTRSIKKNVLQSGLVGAAILRGPWTSFSKFCKTDILLVLSNTVHPLTISGGKMFKINLELFKIVKDFFAFLYF